MQCLLTNSQVQSLQEERAFQARESSKAQQQIERLMGAMGFQKKPGKPNASSKHGATIEPSQTAALQRMQLEETQTQIQPNNQLAESFGSTASNVSGPTPKRPRGSARPLPPQSHHTDAFSQQTKVLPTRSRPTQRQERRSLEDTHPNSQAKSQQVNVSKSHKTAAANCCESQVPERSDENRLQDLDLDTDMEFSKDFIFTSTFPEKTDPMAPLDG